MKSKKETKKVEEKEIEKTKDVCSECGGTGLDARLPASQGKPCPNCSV